MFEITHYIPATPEEEEIFWRAVSALYNHERCQPLANELHKLSKFFHYTMVPSFSFWVKRQDVSIQDKISVVVSQLIKLLSDSQFSPDQFCKLVSKKDDFLLTNFLCWNSNLAVFLADNLDFLKTLGTSWATGASVVSQDAIDYSATSIQFGTRRF